MQNPIAALLLSAAFPLTLAADCYDPHKARNFAQDALPGMPVTSTYFSQFTYYLRCAPLSHSRNETSTCLCNYLCRLKIKGAIGTFLGQHDYCGKGKWQSQTEALYIGGVHVWINPVGANIERLHQQVRIPTTHLLVTPS